MKCPNCEDGTMTTVVNPMDGDPYISEMRADCPHCRGTGEIQEGDWWMCGFDDDSKHRAPRILKNFEGTVRWCVMACPWEEFGFTYNEPHESVFPLYRMERVE